MKEKKGFISTSIIYSFFLVFILLMIAFLMSFVNKRYLIDKTNNNLNVPPDVLACTKGNTLSECLFKSEYMEYVNPDVSESFKSENEDLASASFNEESIKEAIRFKGIPDFTTAATTEEGMFADEDDYGTSYYYRGAENDNYVVFADQVWQIIRVNGDGTIRMIYKGEYNSAVSEIESKVKGKDHVVFDVSKIIQANDLEGYNSTYEQFHFAFSNSSKRTISAAKFVNELYAPYVDSECTGNSVLGNVGNLLCEKLEKDYAKKYYQSILDMIKTANSEAGAYHAHNIGFMVNDNDAKSYDERFANEQDSVVKFILDIFYAHIFDWDEEKYLSNETIFCGDKDILSVKAATGDDLDIYKYSGYNRYYDNQPSLKCSNSGTAAFCASEAVTNLNRYNVQSDACATYNCNKEYSYYVAYYGKCLNLNNRECETSQSSCTDSLGNGALNNPIALITMDELFYAGASTGSGSETFLKSVNQYWTTTVSHTKIASNVGARYFVLDSNGTIKELNDHDFTATIRPVINLKSDILYCSGDGTVSNPYIIGLKDGKGGTTCSS